MPAARAGQLPRSAGLLLAARLTSAATTLVALALISRLRGADALGAVGVGWALGAIAAAISEAGTNSLLIREVSRRAGDAPLYLGAGFLIRLVTIPLTLLG